MASSWPHKHRGTLNLFFFGGGAYFESKTTVVPSAFSLAPHSSGDVGMKSMSPWRVTSRSVWASARLITQPFEADWWMSFSLLGSLRCRSSRWLETFIVYFRRLFGVFLASLPVWLIWSIFNHCNRADVKVIKAFFLKSPGLVLN